MADNMTTKNLSSIARKLQGVEKIAKFMGIESDDADTIVSEILPVLRRKFEVLSKDKSKNVNPETILLQFLQSEAHNVLANYALNHLTSNRKVLLFVVKKLCPAVTDLRAKQIVDRLVQHADQDLADQLSEALGIQDEYIADFKTDVLPRLKKHTKTMYRKRIKNGDADKDSGSFNLFIITNIFIDEFENHTYIRSETDQNNQAILLPDAESIVNKMIAAWKNEIMAEKV